MTMVDVDSERSTGEREYTLDEVASLPTIQTVGSYMAWAARVSAWEPGEDRVAHMYEELYKAVESEPLPSDEHGFIAVAELGHLILKAS